MVTGESDSPCFELSPTVAGENNVIQATPIH